MIVMGHQVEKGHLKSLLKLQYHFYFLRQARLRVLDLRILQSHWIIVPFISNRNNSFLFTVTFEDKRKDNFEKGRLELERRRMELQEKLKKEKDERERKEALEEERRQRAKLEAEQKRQAELEKQRQQQLEMEREQEALRKKMIQQRLVSKCLYTCVL